MRQVNGGCGSPPTVVAVVGPTASGKSDLAVGLALALGGEIVNADAMQLYRGMDIGTAKLTMSERHGVPHHQLDVLEVRDEATVAAYQGHARADLSAITRRGRVPLLVGGSGLYVRAVVDRLEIPPTDPEVRRELEGQLTLLGPGVLHRRLTAADPVAGAAILPSNGRRVVRALEVIAITGRPFSATMPVQEYVWPTVQIGLDVDRELVDRRIEERVVRMWESGLVQEVTSLLPAGLGQGPTASRALGYAQVLAMLEGRSTPMQARVDTVVATRRFARRQPDDPRVAPEP